MATICSLPGLGGCAAVTAAAAAHPALIAAALDAVPVALAIGGISAIGIAGVTGHVNESPEPGTYGALLQARQEAATNAANTAMTQQNEVSLPAALQAQRAVTRTRLVSREVIGSKADAIGANEKATLASIDAALFVIANGPPAEAKAAGDRMQGLADRVAIPSQVPQVRSLGPYYLFSFLPFQTIKVHGTFPQSYPEGVVPLLTLEGKVYKSFSYDSQAVEFQVPTDAHAGGDPNLVRWSWGDLTIPWDAPRFDALARQDPGNKIVVGILPHSAGRAVIDHRVEISSSEELERVTDSFSISPGQGESEQTACLTVSQKDRAEGWKIKPGSARLSPVGGTEGGAASAEAGTQDEGSACWQIRARTDQSRETTGQPPSAWRIAATLRRELKTSKTESEAFDLAWGSSRVFEYPPGTWKLRYSKSNGANVEYTGTDRTSPLLRVESGSRSVRISAYPF